MADSRRDGKSKGSKGKGSKREHKLTSCTEQAALYSPDEKSQSSVQNVRPIPYSTQSAIDPTPTEVQPQQRSEAGAMGYTSHLPPSGCKPKTPRMIRNKQKLRKRIQSMCDESEYTKEDDTATSQDLTRRRHKSSPLRGGKSISSVVRGDGSYTTPEKQYVQSRVSPKKRIRIPSDSKEKAFLHELKEIHKARQPKTTKTEKHAASISTGSESSMLGAGSAYTRKMQQTASEFLYRGHPIQSAYSRETHASRRKEKTTSEAAALSLTPSPTEQLRQRLESLDFKPISYDPNYEYMSDSEEQANFQIPIGTELVYNDPFISEHVETIAADKYDSFAMGDTPQDSGHSTQTTLMAPIDYASPVKASIDMSDIPQSRIDDENRDKTSKPDEYSYSLGLPAQADYDEGHSSHQLTLSVSEDKEKPVKKSSFQIISVVDHGGSSSSSPETRTTSKRTAYNVSDLTSKFQLIDPYHSSSGTSPETPESLHSSPFSPGSPSSIPMTISSPLSPAYSGHSVAVFTTSKDSSQTSEALSVSSPKQKDKQKISSTQQLTHFVSGQPSNYRMQDIQNPTSVSGLYYSSEHPFAGDPSSRYRPQGEVSYVPTYAAGSNQPVSTTSAAAHPSTVCDQYCLSFLQPVSATYICPVHFTVVNYIPPLSELHYSRQPHMHTNIYSRSDSTGYSQHQSTQVQPLALENKPIGRGGSSVLGHPSTDHVPQQGYPSRYYMNVRQPVTQNVPRQGYPSQYPSQYPQSQNVRQLYFPPPITGRPRVSVPQQYQSSGDQRYPFVPHVQALRHESGGGAAAVCEPKRESSGIPGGRNTPPSLRNLFRPLSPDRRTEHTASGQPMYQHVPYGPPYDPNVPPSHTGQLHPSRSPVLRVYKPPTSDNN